MAAVPYNHVLAFKELKSWADRFSSFSDDETLSDITILHEGGKFYAHKIVLAARSDYFKALFTDGFKESTEQTIELREDNTEALVTMLKFCYHKNILPDLGEEIEDHVEKTKQIFIVAEKYLVDGLKRAAIDVILKPFTRHWNQEHVYRALIALLKLEPELLRPFYGIIGESITDVNFLSIFCQPVYNDLLLQHPPLIAAANSKIFDMKDDMSHAWRCSECDYFWISRKKNSREEPPFTCPACDEDESMREW
ncbi:BTB/POZ and MATH domain-containing protein 6 [Elsinoe australis]|uniref:BTB/POZ and MATH domain-containing protein 6 n=1 Tax=Elsinoe australis TaxID=40998 RepID=A0A2P7Z3A9_9PEZI|nr:BTB/POZ and MATH domain-containing protein 6 [Elsinoe australis]